MQKLIAAIGLCSLALLAGVYYELHGLNQRLDAIGRIPAAISAGLDRANDYYTNPKYDAERQADNKRLRDAMTRDLKAVLKEGDPKPSVHPKAPPRPDRP